MQALAWWLIPVTATLLAIAWVMWRNRPRRPADAHHTLAAHQKFTEALERTEAQGAAHVRAKDAGNDSAARPASR